MNPKTIPQTPFETAQETLAWLDMSTRTCRNGDFRQKVMYNMRKFFPDDPLTATINGYHERYKRDGDFREEVKGLMKGGDI